MEKQYKLDSVKQPISEIAMDNFKVIHSGSTNDIIYNDDKFRIGFSDNLTGYINWIDLVPPVDHFNGNGIVKINSIIIGSDVVFVIVNETSNNTKDYYKSCISIDDIFNIVKKTGGGFCINSTNPFLKDTMKK